MSDVESSSSSSFRRIRSRLRNMCNDDQLDVRGLMARSAVFDGVARPRQKTCHTYFAPPVGLHGAQHAVLKLLTFWSCGFVLAPCHGFTKSHLSPVSYIFNDQLVFTTGSARSTRGTSTETNRRRCIIRRRRISGIIGTSSEFVVCRLATGWTTGYTGFTGCTRCSGRTHMMLCDSGEASISHHHLTVSPSTA